MKKITALLLVVMMIVSVFSISALAVPEYNTDCATVVKDKVLKGTPTVDGKLDAIYTESFTVKLHGPAEAYALQNGGEDTTATGTAYALYDDAFVYVLVDVTDTTFMSGDPEYVELHAHPHLNDAVEVRLGDDLEGHFIDYQGANFADHHLFYIDAHGNRFTCYEESMGDEFEKAQNAVVFDEATGKYTVEIAIPVARPFEEGDMIQIGIQIDDVQDDLDTFAAIGLAVTPAQRYDVYCGGAVSGQQSTPVVTPDPVEPDPVVTPDPVEPDPVVTPDPVEPDPVVTPDPVEPDPVVTPDPVEPDPVVTPDPVEPTDPEVTDPEVTDPEVTDPEVTDPEVTDPEVTDPEVTDPEVTDPEVTDPEVTDPEVTDPEVTDPEVTDPEVTDPEVTPDPETPADDTTDEGEEESSNAWIWIVVAAVVVVVAVVAVVVAKKKK